jgi:hypothetical protein
MAIPTRWKSFSWPNTADEPSQVSGDGEVIFLNKAATKEETQALINKAFDIRVERKLEAH